MSQAAQLLPTPYACYQHKHGGAWTSTNPFSQVQLKIDPALRANEHRIEISAGSAQISAGNTQALAEGSSTFSQLLRLQDITKNSGFVKLDPVTIQDSPEYAWRSLQLDLTTSDFEISQLKLLVDALALYKINVLQLVLASNAAWRMEIKGYPLIDTKYSQAELHELSKYAYSRGINLVPVLDLPQGVKPVIAAYPLLGVPNPQPGSHILGAHAAAIQFVQDTLAQAMRTFPTPYLQVGLPGDDLADWTTIPAVKTELSKLNLRRDSELVGHFLEICRDVAAAENHRLIVPTNSELMRLPADAIVLVQNNLQQVLELTSKGYQVIFTQSNSLDLAKPNSRFFGRNTASKIQQNLASLMRQDELRPHAAKRTLVLGFMAHLTGSELSQSQIQKLLFPRIIAFAQQCWNGSKRKVSVRRLHKNLSAQLKVLRSLGLNL